MMQKSSSEKKTNTHKELSGSVQIREKLETSSTAAAARNHAGKEIFQRVFGVDARGILFSLRHLNEYVPPCGEQIGGDE